MRDILRNAVNGREIPGGGLAAMPPRAPLKPDFDRILQVPKNRFTCVERSTVGRTPSDEQCLAYPESPR